MSVFGELNIAQSRVVSDDEDDEFSNLKVDDSLTNQIYWLDENQTKINADELIIADSPTSSVFLNTYMLIHLTNISPVGITCNKSEYKIYKQNHESNNSSIPQIYSQNVRYNYVYLIKANNNKTYIVCQLFNQIKPDEYYTWINQLSEHVNFSKLILFSTYNSSLYSSSKPTQFPCVRVLTSAGSKTLSNMLEQPNFITDLSAAVIHFCVLKKLEFLTFVCYSNSLNVELQSLKAMFNAVSSEKIAADLFLENDVSKKALLSMKSVISSVSALYM